MTHLARCLAIIIGFALFAPAHSAKADEPPSPPETSPAFYVGGNLTYVPNATSRATAGLRVRCDSSSGFDDAALLSQLANTYLVRDAVQEIAPEVAQVELLHTAVSVQVLGLNAFSKPTAPSPVAGGETRLLVVESYDERLSAAELLPAVHKRMVLALQKLGEADEQRYEREMAKMLEEAERISRELQSQQERHQTMARALGIPSSSVETARQRLAKLESELLAASIEHEGLEARQQILEKQIAELHQFVRDELETDPVIAALTKAVDLRAQQAEALRAAYDQPGVGPQSDLLAVDIELAEQQAELARYRRTLLREAGGEQLSELRRRHLETEALLAECAAREAYLESATNALRDVGQLELISIRIELIEQKYRQAMQQINELELRHRRYIRPDIELIAQP